MTTAFSTPLQPAYAGLGLPVALIHGDADTIVPLTIHSEPLARILPAARLTVLPGAGHMPHHARMTEVIAAIDRLAASPGLRAPDQSP